MTRTTLVVLTILLALAGCREPAPVEVDPPGGAEELEVTAIAVADTNYEALPLDSIAVLPGDNLRFSAFLTVNRVSFDNGQGVRTGAFSRVLFEDRNRPVRFLARRFGFHGVDLGTVTLNASPMTRVLHRVRIRRPLIDTVVVAGFEYLADLSSTHAAGETYTWSASAPDSVDAFSLAVTAPDNVTVLAPAGGSVVRRDRPLPLRWTGRGPVSIVVSGFDPQTQRSRPLLQLRPRNSTGSLVVPAKVVRLLPYERFRYYALSFVLANREERSTVGRFPGAVLLQAASVYTTFIELQ